MSNPFNDDDPDFSGFTDQQEAAIVATLEAVGLKPGVTIPKILFSIVQVVNAVSGEEELLRSVGQCLIMQKSWCPQRDLNPCYCLERAMS